MIKKSLRSSIKQKVLCLTKEKRQQVQEEICARISALLQEMKFQCLGVYWPLAYEVDVSCLFQKFSPLCLPDLEGENPVYRPWSGRQDDLTVKSNMPVPASLSNQTVIPDVILVPVIGFTKKCFRLGHGGGFFDRWLKQHPHTTSLGVALEVQKIEDLFVEAHDQALTCIITEKSTYKPESGFSKK